MEHIPYQKVGKKLPNVLSVEEVTRLINAVRNIKHKAIIQTLYSTGMRLEELVNLNYKDINSDRMSIKIRQGKGKKDRYVMLSPTLLKTLREYWISSNPKPIVYLFPGRHQDSRINPRTVQSLINIAGDRAGLERRVGPHLLRHSFGTHLLEKGTNIRIIQKLLGHRNLTTTAVYTHVAKNYINETPSPLDTLNGPADRDKKKEE